MKELLHSSRKRDVSGARWSVLALLQNSNSVPWLLQNYEGIYVKGTLFSMTKFLSLIVTKVKN